MVATRKYYTQQEIKKRVDILFMFNEVALEALAVKFNEFKEIKGEIPADQLAIMSSYQRILEITEGIGTMLNRNLGSLSEAIVRDLLEAYAHFCYMTEKKVELNERALAYYYLDQESDLEEKNSALATLKLMNLKKGEELEAKELLNQEIKRLKKELNKPEFSNIRDILKKIRTRKNKDSREKFSPYFFQLEKDTPKSIKKFVINYLPNHIDSKAYLYGDLSRQVHGANALRTSYIEDNNFSFGSFNYVKKDNKAYEESVKYLV